MCERSCPAVCMLTTLILYVEPLAWEPTHSTSPPVSSSLTLSLFLSLQNPFVLRGEKVTFHPQLHVHLSFHWILKSTDKTSLNGSLHAGFLYHIHLCTETHHSPPACGIKQGHSLLWWAYTFPFSDTELGHRKWKHVCLGEGRYYSNMQ